MRATLLFLARDVPPCGYEVYRVLREGSEEAETTLSSNQPDFFQSDLHLDRIENEFFRVEIDAWNGAILSLFDKTQNWEVIAENRRFGNAIVRERDSGNFWEYNGHCKGDAFFPMNRLHPLPDPDSNRADFSHRYGGDGRVRNGRARVEYNVNFAFGSGFFATRVRLYPGIRRIDIRTTLINNEERVRYRAAFPTTIENGSITREIPFGAVEQPEGEFPAQNWMDYAGRNRGIAILNNGLPGNNVEGGVVMLSLLKCTALKEGYGEVGGFSKSTKTTDGYEIGVTHTFDYAVVPHAGDWKEAKLYRCGLEFNRPLIARKVAPRPGLLPPRKSFFEVSADNVVISAVKAGTTGTIVRVYEAEGRSTRAVRLRCAWKIGSVEETNLIEQGDRPVSMSHDGEGWTFDIGPFEIKTFRIAARSMSS